MPSPGGDRYSGLRALALSPRHWQTIALGYLLVVVYLTLLPFEFDPGLSFSSAWSEFGNIQFERGSSSARQQWVANLLMFVPLGFFVAGWWLYRVRSNWARLFGMLLVATFCLGITGLVEFFQSWLPNRTPSLTDMSANALGGLVGGLIWLISRMPILRSATRDFLRQRSGPNTWLTIYLCIYVFASLLPLDLILSASEWSTKVNSNQWGWLIAPAGCWEGLRCLSLRALEIVIAVPLGLWVVRRGFITASPILSATLAGLLLGLVVEVGQLLTVSGIAEGASVGLRALGALAGGMLWIYRSRLPWRELRQRLPILLLLILPIYLLVAGILVLGGTEGWASGEAIAAQLTDTRWWPFYYHYFVPEATAIQSVLAHLGLYSLIGLGWWLWDCRSTGPGPNPRRIRWAVGCAVVLALLLEMSKLFLQGLRPDIATLLLAALGAGSAYLALWWWLTPVATSLCVASPAPEAVMPVKGQDAATTSPLPGSRNGLWWLPVLLICGFAVSWPLAGGWLALGLAGYALLLWRRPEACALIVPALLPLLFLAPWSGRYFIDAFDLLLAVTVLMLVSHRSQSDYQTQLPRAFAVALSVFVGATILSLLIWLWPLPPISVNTFVDYMSPWNGIRASKGLLWALLLYSLLPRSGVPLTRLLQRRFVPGLILGLAGVCVLLIWERTTYPGLFNFQHPYRVTGLFADMHVGGPSIETYLVMTLPFLLAWASNAQRTSRLLAVLLFVGGLYGLIVTYSRAGYLGFVVAGMVLLGGVAVQAWRVRGKARYAWLGVGLLPVVLVTGIWTLAGGGFAEQRMQQIEHDIDWRQRLWQQGLALRDTGTRATLLGHGPGSFPRLYRARNLEGRIPVNMAFREFAKTGGFLRLGKSESLYLNQRINLDQNSAYQLALRLRSDREARLVAYVCEKHIKHSFECEHATFQPPLTDGRWQTLKWNFNSKDLGKGPWYARRGLVVSIANLSEGRLVDIDSVQLIDSKGENILRNGDFSQGADHWYFTSDALDTYRLENQWLEVLFDQGWIGLVSFILLLVFAWGALARRAIQGEILALAALAALTGTLVIGMFSTIFWSPRLSMLFYLILFLLLARPRQQKETVVQRRRFGSPYSSLFPEQ